MRRGNGLAADDCVIGYELKTKAIHKIHDTVIFNHALGHHSIFYSKVEAVIRYYMTCTVRTQVEFASGFEKIIKIPLNTRAELWYKICA